MLSSIRSNMPAMPAFQLATPKQMLRNLQTSAIAAIVFFAMMYATTKVEGGPVAYVACVTSCMAICAGATFGRFFASLRGYMRSILRARCNSSYSLKNPLFLLPESSGLCILGGRPT